jgi:hypothetical protein
MSGEYCMLSPFGSEHLPRRVFRILKAPGVNGVVPRRPEFRPLSLGIEEVFGDLLESSLVKRQPPLGEFVCRYFGARGYKRLDLGSDGPFKGDVLFLAWVAVAKGLAKFCEMGDSGSFCSFEESVKDFMGASLTLDWFHSVGDRNIYV